MRLRSKLRQRLQIWWLPAVVGVGGALLSAALWHTLEANREQARGQRLQQQAQLFSQAVEQKLEAYGELLYGLVQLGANADATATTLLSPPNEDRYPGVQSMAWAQPGVLLDSDELLAIGKVWPVASTGQWYEGNASRVTALAASVPSYTLVPQTVLSAPVPLSAQTSAVLVSQAVWSPPTGSEQGLLEGVLSLSLNPESLLAYFLNRGVLPDGMVAVKDIGASGPQGVQNSPSFSLFEQAGWQKAYSDAPAVQRRIEVLGRTWELDFVHTYNPWPSLERAYPKIVGLGALVVTALLTALVVQLSFQRWRAQTRVRAKDNWMRRQRDRLRVMLHQSAIGVAEIDPHTGRYLSVNSRFAQVLGYSTQTLESMSWFDVVQPADAAEFRRLESALAAGRMSHFTLTQPVVRGDGQPMWAEAWVSPLLDHGGQCMGRLIVLLLDVTERQALQAQLHAREAYSSEMLRYMPVGLVVVGPQGDIEFVNHQFEVVTGWSQQDLSDESGLWRSLCVDKQQHAKLLQRLNAGRCEVVPTGINMPAAEYLLRNKNGAELPMEVSGRFLDGRILLSFVDLSQRKAAEEEIRWLGFYDTVTQLPNRRLLLEELGKALVHCQRANASKGALLLLDIDNFKSLNETLGHQHGDALLRLVATRLSHCIAGRHTLARQGGDEFAVVLEDLPADPLEAGRRAEQVGCAVLEALRTPFYLGAQDFHVTVSMGAVVFAGAGDTVEELLKRADLALYQAKSAGRDTLQFFDPSMQQAVSARVEMEKDMRLALERHEFDLYFQPQVQKDKVIGAEALLRWEHPVKGFIPPSVFVPAAEESGLILPLGEWVLYAACRQLAHWARDPQLASLTMSVNVSPRQFYQPNFVEQVQQALKVTGASAHLLELELTEGMLLTDVDDTIRKMVQLKAMGLIFSLDDFGTGYSSLSYLKRLPLDKLKIDQSFVREVLTSANDATIARSIIALGNSLGLQVIAEGVETAAQLDFLASSGCHYWQGFFFSRPQPMTEFETWARAYAQRGLPVPEAVL